MLASLAIIAMLVSFAGPVQANGVARGKQLAIALQGLPDSCPTGVAMTGELMIQLADDGTRGRRLVAVDVTVDTPFGDASIYHATFRMAPGKARVIPLNIPVPANAPSGDYHFDVSVQVKGESLTVEHDVYIYGPK
jgi:hypothetical protein